MGSDNAFGVPFYTAKPGDFPEDFQHENGTYQNRCCLCGKRFVGYKRRVVCKVCEQSDMKEREWVER